MPISDTQLRAEEWISHIAWIGKHDDPCAVASEAAGIMRVLLDELAAWIEQAEKSRKIAVQEQRDGAQRVDAAEQQRDELLAAARVALNEMCNTVSPRNSFTDAVDALDAAITRASR